MESHSSVALTRYGPEDLVNDADVVWTQIDFEGKYADCFRIGYNAFDFFIDFAQCGNGTLAVLHTRIIVHPDGARSLLTLLERSVAGYSADHDKLRP